MASSWRAQAVVGGVAGAAAIAANSFGGAMEATGWASAPGREPKLAASATTAHGPTFANAGTEAAQSVGWSAAAGNCSHRVMHLAGAACVASAAAVAGRRHKTRAAKSIRAGRAAVAVLQEEDVEAAQTAELRGTSGGKPLPPGVNPATAWPAGKPLFTNEYAEEYDLSDPKGSFTRVGKMLLNELIDELPTLYEMPAKEVDWVSRSLEYNTQGGKMNRGLIVVETGKEIMLNQGKTPSSRDLNRLAVLGWAVEFLQACMLMADDMMDGSLTRRGNPCWYKLPDVGLLNTNDFLMIEMFVYKIIKRHFGQEPYYPWLLDLFLETTFQTECGQLLDSICANCTLEELTTDRWTVIVKYKTAFYSFYLPVAIAMVVSGVREKEAFDKAREALLDMGIYFQAQDDYLDAFADAEVLGKVGTDIQDKKCSWLFAHAYHQCATPEGKQLLDEHYGKCEVGSKEEQDIKELYKKVGLQELFQQYEETTVQKMDTYRKEIEKVGLPWSVFNRFFGMIHKRKK